MPEPWQIGRRQSRASNRTALAVLFVLIVVALAITLWPKDQTEPKYLGKNCDQLTLQEKVSLADLIVTGQVFIVIPSSFGAEVIIEPTRLYKGALTPQGIRIVADPAAPDGMKSSNGQTSELQFASTQPPYLLFLTARSDGRYDTRACLGSRLFGEGLTDQERQLIGVGEPIQKK